MKYARSNFMTPIPVAASLDDLNAMLAERCRARQNERVGRHAATIGERLGADLEAFRNQPAAPLEPCEKRAPRSRGMVAPLAEEPRSRPSIALSNRSHSLLHRPSPPTDRLSPTGSV